MKYLLDTCALLWLAEGNRKLSATARSIVEDAANEGVVSTVSIWELSMKAAVGKLAIPLTPAELANQASAQGLNILPILVRHVERFHRLPTQHRDPFDRLLVATALDEGAVFLSPDSDLDLLGAERVW